MISAHQRKPLKTSNAAASTRLTRQPVRMKNTTTITMPISTMTLARALSITVIGLMVAAKPSTPSRL